jgi:hemolysin activation/secretion protein
VPNIAFVLSPRAQYAFDPVLSYEEYSAGTYTVGRGYDPGALVADSGVGFQSEIRIGRATPKSATSFAFQPYGFFDAAWVWNRGPISSFHNPQSLYSAGAGLRVSYGNRARLDLTVAAPLKRAVFQEKRGDVRFLVNFTTRLLPWRS